MNANTVAQTVLSQIHKQKGFDHMAKKRIVMALGHDALGTNLPEQKKAVAATSNPERLAGCCCPQQRTSGRHDPYSYE